MWVQEMREEKYFKGERERLKKHRSGDKKIEDIFLVCHCFIEWRARDSRRRKEFPRTEVSINKRKESGVSTFIL